MKRNKMTRKFSLSVSRFATAAVAVAGAIVLSTPQSGAAQVTSGTHYTGGYEGGIEMKLSQCDLGKAKAQLAFVTCITKAQAKGQAVSGARVMWQCEKDPRGVPTGVAKLFYSVEKRDEAACERTLAKAYDSAETRLAGCTTMIIPTAGEVLDWAFGPKTVNRQGVTVREGGHLTPEALFLEECMISLP